MYLCAVHMYYLRMRGVLILTLLQCACYINRIFRFPRTQVFTGKKLVFTEILKSLIWFCFHSESQGFHTKMRFIRGLNAHLCALFPLDWEQIENWRTGHSHGPRNERYN